MSIAQQIYWIAPQFAKNWMASLNARRLDRERHGEAYREVLAEIDERDSWTAEQFAEYQQQKLCDIVRHAARNVPYYRQSFKQVGLQDGKIAGLEELPALPILEKKVARSDPFWLVDSRLDRTKLLVLHTSGTTGTPLKLYRNVWLNSVAFAYIDGRCRSAKGRSVTGLRRGVDLSVSIAGHLVAAPGRSKPPFWVYNGRWKQLYMSSYHLSPEYMDYYVEELRCFGGDYIEGYASSLYAIAKYIVDKELEPVSFKAAFTTADALYSYMRETMEKAFACCVYDQYGAGEMCVLAAECEHGSMHISPDYGIVEVVGDDDQPLPPGQTGQLVCTSLVNRVQPFIRYRLGDMGSISGEPCPCGSVFPVLGSLEGRTDAVLVTRDGRRIGRLDPVFKNVEGVMEAQIVQDDYDKFRVCIVPGGNYSNADGQTIVENLSQRVGQGQIDIEIVDSIERTAAGKFRAVVCNLPAEQRPG